MPFSKVFSIGTLDIVNRRGKGGKGKKADRRAQELSFCLNRRGSTGGLYVDKNYSLSGPSIAQLVPADMRLEFCKIEFRIPRFETFFSQPATDPHTIIIICTGIGCWLTEKRLGSRNSEFDLENSSLVSAGTSCK
jgi:hypothetical protein